MLSFPRHLTRRLSAVASSSFPAASTKMPPNKFTYDVKPENLFEERAGQFINWGIPEARVRKLQTDIVDMWTNKPGGWVYEWSQVAKEFADKGEAKIAANCYGAAKFPTISTQDRQDALVNQVEQYIKASEGFPVKFDRKLVRCYHAGKAVDVPVHILSHPEADGSSPVMIASGGVDTWKMDLHTMWEKFALACKCHVVAFDLPGNGELSHVPMDDKGDEIIHGLIKFARGHGNGTVCHFGFSMGGHYSALSGLRHDVDFAIAVGGPTNDSFTPENALRLAAGYGMDGIMFNAIGRWTSSPDSIDVLTDAVSMFNLKYLLDDDINCPMLVINGDSDLHVSIKDMKEFEGRRDTEVVFFPNTGHCCDAHPDSVKIMIKWLMGKFLK